MVNNLLSQAIELEKQAKDLRQGAKIITHRGL
jgi:hypothetical protein